MLLTIDPGGFLGWTLGPNSADATPDQVAFGSIKLADTTDLGQFLVSADVELQDLMGRGVTRWAIEVPNTRFIKSAAAAAKLMGAYAHCRYWAALMQLPPPEIYSPSEVKLAATGNGTADKDMVMAAMRKLGYAVQNDHEGDAVAIRRAYLFGVPESKSEKAKREAKERRVAKEAARPPKLL